ncbi:MAG: amidohydrolase [Dehalococcoidia bacterium]
MTHLLLHNARVLTMDPRRPRARAVAVQGGRIAAVGTEVEALAAAGPNSQRIDCAGGALLPAFIDAHCHLLSYAASLRSVDCTGARSIDDIMQAVRDRAAGTPPGQWVRAFGYEETSLREGRHPDRHDLDAAAPDHPVRLVHRSGHASVLNSAALRSAGIDIATEEPPGGVIERDLSTGEPSGVLLGMERVIDRIAPPLPYEALAAGVREASGRLLSAGITCVVDATHTNGPVEWALFERLIAGGALDIDVVLMEGIEHLGELPESAAGGRLRRGPVKIILHELGDHIAPDEAELARQVWAVHTAGRQVAIHAVGERTVAATTSAIESALRRLPRDDHRHRIEHCGLLPEGLAPRLARLSIVVVSQPGFVAERGERYLQLVPPEQLASLYAFRTLTEAGVSLAAGSDAPVTAPVPLASVAAAIDRATPSGRSVGPEQAVTAGEAIRWWTARAAHSAFLENERGMVRAGLRADLLLLAADPLDMTPGDLRAAAVEAVWQGGKAALIGG